MPTTRKSKSTASRDKSTRRYGPKAQDAVAREMREFKRGELKSGRSRKKVTSRKQAIAIGLSEARRSGARVPAKKRCRVTSGRKMGRNTPPRVFNHWPGCQPTFTADFSFAAFSSRRCITPV